MKFSSPKIEIGSIVTTFQNNLIGITPKRRYIVEGREEGGLVFIRNDEGMLEPYRSIHFMEADVIFSLLLYMTINRLLNFEKL